jgi:hypothetical protein
MAKAKAKRKYTRKPPKRAGKEIVRIDVSALKVPEPSVFGAPLLPDPGSEPAVLGYSEPAKSAAPAPAPALPASRGCGMRVADTVMGIGHDAAVKAVVIRLAGIEFAFSPVAALNFAQDITAQVALLQ